MDENERQARRNAVAAISKLAIAYDKELTDERIDLYIEALYDLDANALLNAVNSVISTERHFPTIAVIREAAFRDDEALTAEEAWASVCDRIRAYGRSGGVGDLRGEIRAAIASCGGWVALCESTNPAGDKITFVRAYRAASERTHRQQAERWATPPEMTSALQQIGRGGNYEIT